MSEIEPLEAEAWFRAIRSLAERARIPSSDLEEQLRHAYHLVQLAPIPLRDFIRCDCDEDRFEAYLSCGDFACAALALFPPRVICHDTESVDAQVIDTVALPDDENGPFATSAEVGLALLKGWTRRLLKFKKPAHAAALKSLSSDKSRSA